MSEPDYRVQSAGQRRSERARRVPCQMTGRMPPKEPGKHRWIATSASTLTADEAARAHEGVAVMLGVDKLIAFTVGCWDCECEYNAARLDPCPAGDEWSTDD